MIEYRDIAGFPGYRIGSDGSVLSEWGKRGRLSVRTPGESHPLKWAFNQHGYPKVSMRDAGGVKRQRQIARLVLEAFVGACPDGYVCCHFPDPTPSNCNRENLRWGTRKDNENDKRIHGNLPIGDARWNTKLPDAAVAEIREAAATEKVNALARRYGVSHSLVSMIISGKRRALPAA